MYYAKNNGVGSAAQLPDGAIEITEAQYQEALANMRAGKGVKIVDGVLNYFTPEQPGVAYLLDEDGFYLGSGAPDEGQAYMPEPPPADLLKPRAVNGEWVEGEALAVLLQAAKDAKIADINAKAEAAIVGGLVSSALGAPYTYDMEREDQINLLGTERRAAITGQSQPYRCADANGVKEFRLHTLAQLQQVLDDGAAMRLTILQKAATLKLQAAATTTEAELDLIVW